MRSVSWYPGNIKYLILGYCNYMVERKRSRACTMLAQNLRGLAHFSAETNLKSCQESINAFDMKIRRLMEV